MATTFFRGEKLQFFWLFGHPENSWLLGFRPKALQLQTVAKKFEEIANDLSSE